MIACSPPRLIFWETTSGCNLRCLHCRRVEVADQLTPDDLTTLQAEALISDISSYANPILVLSGGEPLFRPDILYLARFAKERGLRVALATNGTLITRALAEEIKKAGVSRVSVSLDGGKEQTHDRFRGPGNHAKALQALVHLAEAGVSRQLNMTVTRVNAQELPQVYEMCLAMNLDALHIFMLVPVGCGVQIADSDMLPAEEYEKWLGWFYEREREDKIELKATCAPHYQRIVRQKTKETGVGLPPSWHRQTAKGHSSSPALHQVTRGCLAGTGVCFISHKGEVFPCGYLPVNAGNILRQSFKDVWENSAVFQEMRDPALLTGKCGECPYNVVCGGCRARAYAQANDYLAEEPYCVYATL